ncbi:hypothetical protein AKJ37_04975 [candidate division MSBL1 archaeon SCGC-AAA259I09]|uniref:Uncharacterized protein n=1 Tax=candidate division MSBL1 archaeon SCGC-AAA259I09 TaxID=1698267 RepID=A0A133UQR5_9EURY|nr:hypothetical protein AKJ37_04975 [candidate division MSBL1 archaeon SCGC-AAA259I09]
MILKEKGELSTGMKIIIGLLAFLIVGIIIGGAYLLTQAEAKFRVTNLTITPKQVGLMRKLLYQQL